MTRTTQAPRRRGRPPGPGVDPGARREDVLDAAERVIARTGPSVAFADVAVEAGFARTAIYAVFPDRDSLLGALTERHTARLTALADVVLAQPLPLREIFRRVVDTICTFVADNPRLHPALMQGLHTPRHNGHRPLFTDNTDWATAVLTSVLEVVDGDRRLARTWAGATIGAVLLAAEDWAAHPTVGQAELVDQLTAFIWPAIASIGGDAVHGPFPQAAGTLSKNPST